MCSDYIIYSFQRCLSASQRHQKEVCGVALHPVRMRIIHKKIHVRYANYPDRMRNHMYVVVV
jgi:hypothetical protein